jgi:hypothetical protein
MSQFVDGNTKAFRATEAIPMYSRVKITSTGVAVAGLAEKEIGTAATSAFAAGELVTVRLRTAAGTHKMIAIEALTVGSEVYTETSGKVQDTAQATSFRIGVALEAATADGDIIEVLYNAHGDTAVP